MPFWDKVGIKQLRNNKISKNIFCYEQKCLTFLNYFLGFYLRKFRNLGNIIFLLKRAHIN